MNESRRMAEEVIRLIEKSVCDHEPMLVAIDGRCASGKSTVASLVGEMLDCDVVHMDDFFLQQSQRTPARLLEPGGNVDYERVEAEVLQPAKCGLPVCYRKFDCSSMDFGDEVKLIPKKYLLVEGAYSCHPKLRDYFDLRIFMTIDADMQMARIIERNGSERAQMFRDRWIPLEETYIRECGVPECCAVSLQVEIKGVCSVDQGKNIGHTVQV